MSKPILRLGSRGTAVRDLQEALNPYLAPSSRLTADGIYGTRTFRAVRAFQGIRWLSPDGVAGPMTYAALDAPGDGRTVLHGTSFHAQPDNTTCWAAATAMMTGLSIAAVQARTPPEMIAPGGGLLNASDKDDAITSRLPFARAFGLRILPPMSHSIGALMAMLDRSPLMVGMLWNPKAYGAGKASPGHLVLVPGYSTRSGSDAVLLVYDPGPVKRGEIRADFYSNWVREVPALTYAIFERA